MRRAGPQAGLGRNQCRSALRCGGVSKGAFFHHFASKDELGVATAQHWSDVTGPLFAKADYHRHADAPDRIFGYIGFRAAIANGPIEAFTCFAGTTGDRGPLLEALAHLKNYLTLLFNKETLQ